MLEIYLLSLLESYLLSLLEGYVFYSLRVIYNLVFAMRSDLHYRDRHILANSWSVFQWAFPY